MKLKKSLLRLEEILKPTYIPAIGFIIFKTNFKQRRDFTMPTLQTHVKNYLEYCTAQKRLDEKTLKAYRIDLRQFFEQFPISEVTEISSSELEAYIARLNQVHKPKTAKKHTLN